MSLREHRVAELADIAEPGALEFKAGEGDWPFRGMLVRWRGAVHAYANVCPHLRHPLNLQPDEFFDRSNELLICRSHGAIFEPDTGLCVGGPCAGRSLQSLDCRVEDGTVYVTSPNTLLGD